jgi:hypothetical protein
MVIAMERRQGYTTVDCINTPRVFTPVLLSIASAEEFMLAFATATTPVKWRSFIGHAHALRAYVLSVVYQEAVVASLWVIV